MLSEEFGNDSHAIRKIRISPESSVAALVRNEARLASNATLLGSFATLLACNATLLTSNAAFHGSNTPLPGSFITPLTCRATLLASNAAWHGSNAPKLTSNVAMQVSWAQLNRRIIGDEGQLIVLPLRGLG